MNAAEYDPRTQKPEDIRSDLRQHRILGRAVVAYEIGPDRAHGRDVLEGSARMIPQIEVVWHGTPLSFHRPSRGCILRQARESTGCLVG
jgi:hypothetical protein